MEKACAPAINTGMFAAMKEAGDVMGTFVGHDHDNDYSVMWKGIVLAYGRFTGGNTEYNHLSNGARVIVLKEGERTFTSWIRLKNGELIDKTVYPDSYVKDNPSDKNSLTCHAKDVLGLYPWLSCLTEVTCLPFTSTFFEC